MSPCLRFIVPVLAGLLLSITARAHAESAWDELVAAYDAWIVETQPEVAVRRGDFDAVPRLADRSLAALALADDQRGHFLERATAIDERDLSESDRVSRALFILMLERERAGYELGLHLMPVTQRSGGHHTIVRYVEGVPLRNRADWNHYLQRLEQVPRVIEQTIGVLREGVRRELTPPRVTLDGVPAQIDALLGVHGLEPLRAPLATLPASLTERDRESITLRLDGVILPAIRAWLEAYRTFMVETYLPACRASIAATDLPNGDALYAHQLRTMTTTALTAAEIHERGQYEVERIRSEMLLAIRRTDFLDLYPEHADADDDALFAAFIAYLRSDARFYFDDARALVDQYRIIAKRIDGMLPRYFRTLPRTPYGIKPIPAAFAMDQTTAYYLHGNLAAGEAGWMAVNTYALDQRPRYEMIALTMHEAVPGHHLQAALASELEDVPAFRRDLWFTAFGEGWALYAERLGIEMGLYTDPYDDFGRLLYEMWRACRLVVDTGIHAFDWSRDDAIAYMRDHTALSEHNIRTEIDRYISWPGQACAYKIGELRIRALRHRAEEKLGASFDVREFHEIVLGAGSIPLDVLDDRITRWIRSKPLGAAYD